MKKLIYPLRDSIRKLQLADSFVSISDERKEALKAMALGFRNKLNEDGKLNLIWICTHNSRRSIFAQAWSQAAAIHFGFPDVKCFSGGTEVTAVYPSVLNCLEQQGFERIDMFGGENPMIGLAYLKDEEALMAYSKFYDANYNPRQGFIAVMVCSSADQNCPAVFGADARYSLPYEDPKLADGSPEEMEVYENKSVEIAREMFFLFSQV